MGNRAHDHFDRITRSQTSWEFLNALMVSAPLKWEVLLLLVLGSLDLLLGTLHYVFKGARTMNYADVIINFRRLLTVQSKMVNQQK